MRLLTVTLTSGTFAFALLSTSVAVRDPVAWRRCLCSLTRGMTGVERAVLWQEPSCAPPRMALSFCCRSPVSDDGEGIEYALLNPGDRLTKDRLAVIEFVNLNAFGWESDESWDWEKDESIVTKEAPQKKQARGLSIQYDDVAQLRGAPCLKSLVLTGKTMEVPNKTLGLLATLPKLRALILVVGGLRDDDVRPLRHLTGLNRLEINRCLGARKNRITDKGVGCLAELHQLRVLRIEHCRRVNGSCFKDLAEIKSLRELDVWDCSVDDRIEKYLDGFQHLRSLDLRGTNVTDKIFDGLAEMPSLKIVNVTGTKATWKATEKFRSRHPNITVYKLW